MHCIASKKYSVEIAEFWRYTLADAIDGEPVHDFVLQLIRVHDSACGAHQHLRLDMQDVNSVVFASDLDVVELDVKPHESAFSGNGHDAAVGGGVDGAGLPYVGCQCQCSVVKSPKAILEALEAYGNLLVYQAGQSNVVCFSILSSLRNYIDDAVDVVALLAF